jgi:hypothetical protein
MPFPYSPHANARQASAQRRALRRATRQPCPASRVGMRIASAMLTACGGLLAVLFLTVAILGANIESTAPVTFILYSGALLGLYTFASGIYFFCSTFDY